MSQCQLCERLENREYSEPGISRGGLLGMVDRVMRRLKP